MFRMRHAPTLRLWRVVQALSMRVVTILLVILSVSPAKSQGFPLNWRRISIGMSAQDASAALRAIGLVAQHIEYGGRQEESWEGTLAAFPPTGHCSGALGQQCEEAFLSLVKFPNGDERVWIISTHTHFSQPALVDRVTNPAIKKYGQSYTTTFFKVVYLPNDVEEAGSMAFTWKHEPEKSVELAFDFYPSTRSQTGSSNIAPISPEARTWGADVTIADKGISSAAKVAYLAQERNSLPPIRY